jgi:6-phosphogluconate dehydrogenase
MGGNMVRRLLAAGHSCVVYDRQPAAAAALIDAGRARIHVHRQLRVAAAVASSDLADAARGRRRFCNRRALPHLSAGDIVIDGGNSHYVDAIRRAKALEAGGVHFVDVGVSGGVWGLERGYCLMIGGAPEPVQRLESVFRALAPGTQAAAATPGRGKTTADEGYLHCGAAGAGHFVKMVHNGIEYALMGAYAEGFNILAHANAGGGHRSADAETAPLAHPEHYQYDLPLPEIAELWRRGSVIGSWLLDLTARALAEHPGLETYAGHVADSGEGRWTAAAAIETSAPAPILTTALFNRFSSRGEDDLGNRLLSAMRHQFGGHVERKP